MWTLGAGIAQATLPFVVPVFYPYLQNVLISLAYLLLLPAIAALHPRQATARQSGAVLATAAGTATVTVGLAGSVIPDLAPGALFALGLWWWVSGKLWAETAVLPRSFGTLTLALAVIAFALVPLVALSPLAISGLALVGASAAAPPYASAVHEMIAIWCIALAILLWRDRTRS